MKIFDYYSSIAPPDSAAAADETAETDDLAELTDIEVTPINGDPDWNADLWISEAAEPILGQREI